MKRHGSMNRSFRLVWNSVHQNWVAVAETSRARGKSGRLLTSLASAAVLLVTGVPSWAGPEGGQVVSGTAVITQTGSPGQVATTVQQGSDRVSIQWQSFNLGAQERVAFLQPSATSLAVNRIVDTQGSQILGRIQANGQVWLINPNGVLFGRQAQVDVAGLVASTLDQVEFDAAGGVRWTGSSRAAVVNQGQITAAPGGHVALLGHEVVNDGVVSARLGTVALGSGSDITLKLRGNSLLSLQVDGQLLNAQAANGGILRADGGQVLVTAGARDSLLASVVNNTGVVEARTVQEQAGRIVLLAGKTSGTMNVAGTLDASAPEGGAGGFIETSGAQVRIAEGSRVNTQAASGPGGRWLIDPTDFTVAASGGDISGATLSANLATTDVELRSESGSRPGSGDVNINDAVTWSSSRVLTLTAANSVNLNASITATSNSPAAGLRVNFGTGGFNLAQGVTVNLPNVPVTSTNALVINDTPYTVINRLGTSTDIARQTLQGLKNDVDGGAYALGSDIDASATATWNRGAGFQPIGTADLPFAGTFNGLGHRITNLTINRPTTDSVGLFGYASGATLSDVHLVGASVRGRSQVGALAGYQDNLIERSSASGNVTGAGDYIGGLVGYNDGVVSRSSSSAAVSGVNSVGGLVGLNNRDQVISSRASGSVSGSGDRVGGLVGDNQASVVDSQASGTVNGATAVGGLVGWNEGTITGGVASGAVNGVGSAGGLVGYNASGASIEASRATGAVNAAEANAGGLVGENDGSVSSSVASGSAGATDSAGGLVGLNGVLGTVETSQASGAANADRNAGGLIGDNQGGVTDSRASGAVSGITLIGGLAGNNDGSIVRSRATGSVTAGADADGMSAAGGLVGFNNGTISESYATGKVTGTGNAVGGLVGNNNFTVEDSHASGAVAGADAVGGLVGLNTGSVDRSLSRGAVTGSGAIGGLVGFNDTGGSVAASYWDVAGSGLASSDGGIGLSASGMLQSTNFAGFDFGSKWVQVDGLSQPLLRSLLTPLTVTVDRGAAPTRTYDGTRSVPAGQVRYSSNGTAVTPDATLLQGTLTAALDSPNVGLRNVTLGGLFSSSQDGYRIDYSPATVTVTPASLTIAARSDSKVYDGGLASTLAPTASGLRGNDTLVNATQAFTSRHALGQGGSTLAVTGYTVQDGNGGANYTVTTTAASGTITPAPLTIAASTETRAYDGTTLSAASPTVSGLVGSDQISGLGQAFGSRHVLGTGGSTLTVTGYTINDGRNGANYAVTTRSAAGTILPAPLTIAAVTDTKVYDGTTRSTAVPRVSGLLGGDSVGANAQSFGSKDVLGTNGSTLVVVPGSVSDGNGGRNYTINATTATGTINPASLTVTATALDKVYDATPSASVTLGSNAVAGDSLTFSQASAAFSDRHAGTAIPVTVTGIAVSGRDAANYLLTRSTATTAASITPAVVTLTAATDSKVYDGSTQSSATPTISGLLGTDTLVSATQAFASRNVLGAGGSSLVVTGETIQDGRGGSNYSVQRVAASGTITPAPLTVTAVSDSKVYDATTVSARTPVVTGLLSGDTAPAASQAFASRHVMGPTGSTLVASAGALNDGNSGRNYSVTAVSATGTITPAPLNIAAVGDTKVYDGGTSSRAVPTVSGLLGSDTLGDVRQAFTSRQVSGTGGSVLKVSSYVLNDGNAGANYRVTDTATSPGTITPAPLSLRGLVAVSKVYDRSVSAGVSGTAAITAIGQDDVRLSGTPQAQFADALAGTGKAVSVTGLTLAGADAVNYALMPVSGLFADITPAPVSVTGLTAVDKVYDTTTAATLSGSARVTPISGDTITLSGTPLARFASPDAGRGKPVTVTGLTLTGPDAANYRLQPLTGLQAAITPATLQYVATPASAFQGQSPGQLSGVVTGLVGADTLASATTGTVVWTTTATAASPVGEYPIAGGGLQSSNYVLAQAPGNATAFTLRAGTLPPTVTDQVAAISDILGSSPPPLADGGGRRGRNSPAATGGPSGSLLLPGFVQVVDGGVRLPDGAVTP